MGNTLTITNSIVQYQNKTIAVKNITGIKTTRKSHPRPESIEERTRRIEKIIEHETKVAKSSGKIFEIILTLLSLALAIFFSPWWLIAALFFIWLGLKPNLPSSSKIEEETNRNVPYYDEMHGIEIFLNSGSVELLWSTSKPFIEKIEFIISQAMSNQSNGNITIVNIDKQEIKTENHTHVVNKYEINIKHQHGMDKDDLDFITGAFAKSIKELGEKIEAAGKPELTSEFQKMVEQFNAEKPDKNLIDRLWKGVKIAAEGLDVASKISEAHVTIMAAVGLIGKVIT